MKERIITKVLTKIGVAAVATVGLIFLVILLFNTSSKALKEIAAGFSSGKVINDFHDYILKIEGSNRLQVASLKSFDSFSKSDSKNIFWDLIKLPDVVVEFQAPIEYTYFIDMTKKWEFRWKEKEQVVVAVSPPLEPGTPAVDVSNMKIIVREGSFLRDADEVKEKLKNEMTGRLLQVAAEKIPSIRETARTEAKKFLQDWFMNFYFKNSEVKPKNLIVYFSDEDATVERSNSTELEKVIN